MSGVNVSRLIRRHERLRRGLTNARCIVVNSNWRSNDESSCRQLRYTVEDAKIYTGNRLYRNVVSPQLGAVVGSPMTTVKPSAVPNHIGGFCLVARLTNTLAPSSLTHLLTGEHDQAGRYVFGKFISKYDLTVEKVIQTGIWMNDDKERLSGSYSDAVQSVTELLSDLSGHMTLGTGDVILLGSPIEKRTWSDVRSVAIGINCATDKEPLERMEIIYCHKHGLMPDKTAASASFEM